MRPVRGEPDRPAGGFELLDHPADVKLRAWGNSLEELFVKSAEGMMAYLFGSDIVAARRRRTETVELAAPDREALLVDWLSELLYRATSEYNAYTGFCVLALSETALKATASAVTASAIEDIKAVTHHELSIRKREDGCWEATIVFDI
jgi:SHS2 domain-containing protein